MRIFLALLLVGLAGCQQPPHEILPPPGANRVHDEKYVEVSPEQRAWLIEHTKAAVVQSIPTPATARFVQVPDVSASYSPSRSRTKFLVGGEVDAENLHGALIRNYYTGIWTQGDGETEIKFVEVVFSP